MDDARLAAAACTLDLSAAACTWGLAGTAAALSSPSAVECIADLAALERPLNQRDHPTADGAGCT